MLTITTPDDIVIPFKRIGDTDWEIKTSRIIAARDAEWGNLSAIAKTEHEIIELEQRLGVKLPKSLTQFYQTFGIADIGEQLMDFDQIGLLSDIWSFDPQYGPQFSEQEKALLPLLITFSDYLGNGNMFCFHSQSHEIYYFDHDGSRYLTKLFSCVDDYLKGCLIYSQTELFDINIGQDQVEQWTLELLIKLYGQDVITKWMF